MSAPPPLTQEKVFRVLCFDDKESHREATRSLLEEQAPIRVDFAATCAEADQHITAVSYDVVLVDIDLRETEGAYQGDDWLYDRFDSLGGAEPYVVTAQKGMIRRRGWLQEKHIPVVEKGHKETALYQKLRHRASAIEAPGFAEPPAFRFVTNAAQEERARMILERTLGTFYDWIDRLPDANVQDLYLDGMAMSPAEIKRAMRDPDSEIGRTMVDLFVDHVRDLLGFDSTPEAR